jgi:hypothetical protein
MYPLVALYNHDRERCGKAVEQLIMPNSPAQNLLKGTKDYEWLTPLITNQGLDLLRYLQYWLPDIGSILVQQLLDSGDRTMRHIGAWLIFQRSFQDSDYIEIADCLVEEGSSYRRLATGVAADAVTEEEYRGRAIDCLIHSFSDPDKDVRHQAARGFGPTRIEDKSLFETLANAYLSSPTFDDESEQFFQVLEDANFPVTEYVVRAAERVINTIDSPADASAKFQGGLYHLTDLLKREYAGSENLPELRGRLLDVIDRMFELELYGTDDIVSAHERN